jgi:ABC-2 type transport system permease protein
MSEGRKQHKKQDLMQLLLAAGIILLIGIVSQYKYFRIDLTSEKRFTLSSQTREILREIDDVAFVKIYLEGDLPIGFKRLRNSVKEMLDEFRMIAGSRIQYQFINPSENTDPEGRMEFFKSLEEMGMVPVNVEARDKEGGTSQKIIFPWALISYKGYELPVRLLKNNPGKTAEENFNQSSEALEYELISAMSHLMTEELKSIAFIEGHGELDEYLLADITDELLRFYEVFRGRIDPNSPHGLNEISLVIIAKPERPFSENEKAVLDQYIMHGGRVMWLIDPVAIDLDSLTTQSSAVALIRDLNLEDQLFRYGVRVNHNLLMDLSCTFIPINTSLQGQPAQFTPAPWYYSPLLNPPADHNITRNLNLIKGEFISTLDTVGANPEVEKTVLLRSSEYSRIVNAPLIISLETARRQINPAAFNQSEIPVAVLLEGVFPSVFTNRPFPIETGSDFVFLAESSPTKMIVIGDGDFIRNDVALSRTGIPEPLPLGYDRFTRQTFGNKEFIMNAVNFLLDERDLMSLRNRQLTLRLLDREKIREQRFRWQLFNILLPLLVISIFGFAYTWFRNYKYAK